MTVGQAANLGQDAVDVAFESIEPFPFLVGAVVGACEMYSDAELAAFVRSMAARVMARRVTP